MKHILPSDFLRESISVHVIGAGGNGAQFVNGLARMHVSLKALGHPHGLNVSVHDPDRVTPANIGRQLFSPSDVGQLKADVLVNRLNAFYGLRWRSIPQLFQDMNRNGSGPKILVGCVDSRESRQQIGSAFDAVGDYWLDLGNEASTGQVILGSSKRPHSSPSKTVLLPTVIQLFRELHSQAPETDDAPSCSLAGALQRQDLFVNQMVASWALHLLWQLFRQGGLDIHGYFINLAQGLVAPLPIDPQGWERFGYCPNGNPNQNPPLRRIKKTLKQARPFHAGLFKLSCGHVQKGFGRRMIRCRQCK